MFPSVAAHYKRKSQLDADSYGHRRDENGREVLPSARAAQVRWRFGFSGSSNVHRTRATNALRKATMCSRLGTYKRLPALLNSQGTMAGRTVCRHFFVSSAWQFLPLFQGMPHLKDSALQLDSRASSSSSWWARSASEVGRNSTNLFELRTRRRTSRSF